MFRANEIVNLALTALSAPFLLVVVRQQASRSLRVFGVGFCLMLLSYIATNAESVVLPAAMNAVEHLALAGSGVAFAFGTYVLRGEFTAEGEEWT